MTEKINLSGWKYGNWGGVDRNAPPPVVFNPDTKIHSAVAWCWGEAAELHELCLIGLDGNPDDAATLLSLFQGRLQAIRDVLSELGDRTRRMTETVGEPGSPKAAHPSPSAPTRRG